MSPCRDSQPGRFRGFDILLQDACLVLQKTGFPRSAASLFAESCPYCLSQILRDEGSARFYVFQTLLLSNKHVPYFIRSRLKCYTCSYSTLFYSSLLGYFLFQFLFHFQFLRYSVHSCCASFYTTIYSLHFSWACPLPHPHRIFSYCIIILNSSLNLSYWRKHITSTVVPRGLFCKLLGRNR